MKRMTDITPSLLRKLERLDPGEGRTDIVFVDGEEQPHIPPGAGRVILVRIVEVPSASRGPSAASEEV